MMTMMMMTMMTMTTTTMTTNIPSLKSFIECILWQTDRGIIHFTGEEIESKATEPIEVAEVKIQT